MHYSIDGRRFGFCVLGHFHCIFDIVQNLPRFRITVVFRTCMRSVFSLSSGLWTVCRKVTRRKINIGIPGFLQEIVHCQPFSLLLFLKDKNIKILVCVAFSGHFSLRFFGSLCLHLSIKMWLLFLGAEISAGISLGFETSQHNSFLPFSGARWLSHV